MDALGVGELADYFLPCIPESFGKSKWLVRNLILIAPPPSNSPTKHSSKHKLIGPYASSK
jgi:hypothetical protein